MLLRSFPRWAVWALNLVVFAILFLLARALGVAGEQFVTGCLVGFFFLFFGFRLYYGWWPNFGMDGEEATDHLPRKEPGR